MGTGIYAKAIDLLKRMVSVPSFSREENEVADILGEYMKGRGMEVKRKLNNLYCLSKNFDPLKPTILLNAHIDTVKPVAGWIFDPFAATEKDGRIYGLGTNDDGASVVCLLEAFLELQQKEQPNNFIFLASAEEEVSGKNGIESVLPDLPPCALAVVGEPTRMDAAIAEKGLMVLDCTAYGKAGHAAREEGINAIYQAVEDIEWFRSTELPGVSGTLGKVKMSVTMINAGTQHNVVPDRCAFVVDIRSNECYSNQEIYEYIRSQIKSEVAARSFRLNSSGIELSHPFVKRAMALGCDTFGSPTLSDQALIPFTSVKIGPGDSSRSHMADEYIEISEIQEGIRKYVQLLDGLDLS